MVTINPADCGPDEAYVGTVHGKRRIMVRCAQKDALGSSVWLVARPDWQSHEYVTDHMVSDLVRLVPAKGGEWTAGDLPRVLELRQADDERGTGERTATLAIALDAVVAHLNAHHPKPDDQCEDCGVDEALKMVGNLGRGMMWAQNQRAEFRRERDAAVARAEQAEQERDEWKARAGAAEARLADPYSQANQDAAAWDRVAAHPALRMDLLPEADHTYAGRVFERITWLAEVAEAVTEMKPAEAAEARTTPAVPLHQPDGTRMDASHLPIGADDDPAVFVVRESDIEDCQRNEDGDWEFRHSGRVFYDSRDPADRAESLTHHREQVAQRVAIIRAIEAEPADPVTEKARELHEVAQGDGPFIVWEALTDVYRTHYRRMAAHVLGQGDRHVDQ